ncbi:MAG: hypothetical protein CMB80_07970 [Flammeovirgaceae bacterium]|nr:hypothetical protein [Flammeovirgaceae bacterium]
MLCDETQGVVSALLHAPRVTPNWTLLLPYIKGMLRTPMCAAFIYLIRTDEIGAVVTTQEKTQKMEA